MTGIYEATQKQRYIERQIRKYKREVAGLDAAGIDSTDSRNRLAKWQQRQIDFIEQTGLKRDYNREQIEKSSKAVDTVSKRDYNYKKDKKQFEAYKERLGADAPKDLEAFQVLKYDNPSAYEDISGYYRYKGNNPDSNKGLYKANNAVKAMRANGTTKTKGTITAAPKGCSIVEINAHAAKRMAERGITQEMAQHIIDNADFAIKQRKGTQYAYYTKDGFAVLDNNGVLGTTGPLDEGGKKLYDEVMKNVRDSK